MKAVLFDFDGTLADTLPVLYHSFRTVFLEFDGQEYSDEEIRSMFGPPETEIIETKIQHPDKESARKLFYETYEKNHQKLVKENEMVTYMLDQLSGKVQLGIITGKARRSLEISLRELRMEKYFDVLVPGDEVEKTKPAPEGIEKALMKIGVNKEAALFTGDSDGDINAGLSAGVETVGALWLPNVQQTSFNRQPDRIFKDPGEFLNFCLNKI
ncbi:MAG: HAD family hydrolase, partial [Alkalicoccus sp.]